MSIWFGSDSTSVTLHKCFNYKQAKAYPFSVLTDAVFKTAVAFKHLGHILLLNADASIFYCYVKKISLPIKPVLNIDIASLGKLDCILNQVDEDLLEAQVISFYFVILDSSFRCAYFIYSDLDVFWLRKFFKHVFNFLH